MMAFLTRFSAGISGLIALCSFVLLVSAAEARPKQTGIITCDPRGCRPDVATRAHAVNAPTGQGIVGRRPKGCPHRFCGCEASLFKFGVIKPYLNLAWNWARKFPRTTPRHGMAAVRHGHVMILLSHVEGKDWLVHDGNSGGGYTREHVRSISGYVIVNPDAQVAGL